MSARPSDSPTLDVKEKNILGPPDTEPSTPYLAPLEDVERATRPAKGKWMQLLTVLVSGVALFSDGYNIQVTGMSGSFGCGAYKPAADGTAYTNTVLTKV